MRIVFFGTPEFAVESLSLLHDSGLVEIAAVVTMPDKPAGRGHKMLQSPVKQYALDHGLHLLQPEKLKNPEFIAELRSLDADLFIVIAFRMLPEAVWSMPPLGTFNLHASLLPKYRGAAPINWAVINGDKVTGVTTFFLKHEIDTGDIISQSSITIGDDENVGSVHDRLMALGARLTLDTVKSIIAGNLVTTPQDALTNGATPTPAPKIFKDTCMIDWTKDASSLHNFIRGLSPYPAAWCTLQSTDGAEPQLKIFEARPSTLITVPEKAVPGSFIVEGDRLLAVCGDSTLLEILSLQLEGKRRMSTAEFLRGYKKNFF